MKPGDLLISDYPDPHTPQPILVVETYIGVARLPSFVGIDPNGNKVVFKQWGWKVISEKV